MKLTSGVEESIGGSSCLEIIVLVILGSLLDGWNESEMV